MGPELNELEHKCVEGSVDQMKRNRGRHEDEDAECPGGSYHEGDCSVVAGQPCGQLSKWNVQCSWISTCS